MKTHAFTPFIFVTLVYAAHGIPSSHIVGGRDAAIGAFPYQVSLRERNEHFCGGSIIDRYNILTAAQCIRGKNSSIKDISIHVGTIFLNQTGDAYEAEKLISHKDSSSRYINDVGLIHLKTPIKFNKLAQPIKLATNDTGIEGKTCKLTGWGRLRLGGAVPNNLQQIDLIIYSQTKCKNEEPRVTNSHICTYTKIGEGACYGDFGGPLVVGDAQVGIISFGRPCAIGYPDVYTRVTSFQNWIKQNLKK